MNGVLGILKEDLIDLAEESQQNIRGLRFTLLLHLNAVGLSSSVTRSTNAFLKCLKLIISAISSIVGATTPRTQQTKFQTC